MTIHIKSCFTPKEAKIILAGDVSAKICDKNNFRCFDFKDQKIEAHGEDEGTVYLFNKAVSMGANAEAIKPAKAAATKVVK